VTELIQHAVAPPFDGWRLCSHCSGLGTCRTGNGTVSCFVCAKTAGVADPDQAHHGLPCSICHGHGCSAPREVKTNRLMGAYVTIICSASVFIIIALSGFFFKDQFDKVLTFGGTVIGSITGFYFGGQSKGNKQNA